MKKFNLRKRASADSPVISDKSIKSNRDDMGLSVKQQGVVEKNINLSLTVKNKDNTVPFNAQLNAARKNSEAEPSITESNMDKKEVDFNSKDKVQVMDINVESQKYDTEHNKALKDAESKKDTAFWDKYVGVQLECEGQPTKIKDNIPSSASQLQNNPDRFKGEKVDKMIMASVKDADAMLFHIFATASKANRKLTAKEDQQVIDINAGKIRILAQGLEMVQPFRRSLEYSGGKKKDPTIRNNGKSVIVLENGMPIDEFKSCEEAKQNYPEGDIENG